MPSDICDVCGAERTRTPTGGWQCEPCDGITALRERIAALESQLAGRRKDCVVCAGELRPCVCLRCNNQRVRERDEAREVARQLAKCCECLDAYGAAMQVIDRYDWLKEDDGH